MTAPREAILAVMKTTVGTSNYNLIQSCVFSNWQTNTKRRFGPDTPVIIEAGEALLLLGADIYQTRDRVYCSDHTQTVHRITTGYYLKFLRLKTSKYVWILADNIYRLPLHESARRGLMKYIKKNKLERDVRDE